MLAVSPLAQMRSAPTTTHCTCPVFIRCAAAASAIRVASMPSCAAPTRSGARPAARGGFRRRTRASMRPCGHAGADHAQRGAEAGGGQRAGIAVGQHAAAGLRSARRRARPCARLAARSSVSMARASRSSAARQSSPGPARPARSRMRASAQARLTAVGPRGIEPLDGGLERRATLRPHRRRPAARAGRAPRPRPRRCRWPARRARSARGSRRRPRRCCGRVTYSTANGSLRWSSSSSVSPVQRIGRMWS